MRTSNLSPPALEIFILTGGLSSRMGRDKSRIRIGRRTLLRHVRDAAGELGFPVRVIRRDAVARCGPLGGMLTALKRSRAETILLLACDMPLVSPDLLRRMVRSHRGGSTARFAGENGRAGFPCVLDREKALPIIVRQIAQGEFSLQSLAKKLRAKTVRPPRNRAHELTNINTPEDLRAVILRRKSVNAARAGSLTGRRGGRAGRPDG